MARVTVDVLLLLALSAAGIGEHLTRLRGGFATQNGTHRSR
jgi:hypothetical protein